MAPFLLAWSNDLRNGSKGSEHHLQGEKMSPIQDAGSPAAGMEHDPVV